MDDRAWTVAKVGGSLYDWPGLKEGLRTWLDEHSRDPVLLVPGGGATADAIRDFDRTHHLGDEAAHWLAIRSLSLNAHFLHTLVPKAKVVADLDEGPGQARVQILDAYPFFRNDEATSAPLPHRWDVTSDSLAVRVAARVGAIELILLKSIAWEGNDWDTAARKGIVDPFFAQALRKYAPGLKVTVVNLRSRA